MPNPPLTDETKPLPVLIAGPYRSGTDGGPAKIAANRALLESPVYRHVEELPARMPTAEFQS
jgi:hypothetical protein